MQNIFQEIQLAMGSLQKAIECLCTLDVKCSANIGQSAIIAAHLWFKPIFGSILVQTSELVRYWSIFVLYCLCFLIIGLQSFKVFLDLFCNISWNIFSKVGDHHIFCWTAVLLTCFWICQVAIFPPKSSEVEKDCSLKLYQFFSFSIGRPHFQRWKENELQPTRRFL